jgi:glycosyltransferase involved in cell wall biosynthesis
MMMKNKLVSIVVPAYNEEESIPLFMEEISKVFASIENVQFECIFIDDGSNDSTLEVLEYMFQKYPQVKYISFSRNFGKEAALLAGLTESLKGRGDFIAVMDADLQDPPSLLPEMLNAITEEGFDCVATRRVTRKGEPPIRSFFAKCFYKKTH